MFISYFTFMSLTEPLSNELLAKLISMALFAATECGFAVYRHYSKMRMSYVGHVAGVLVGFLSGKRSSSCTVVVEAARSFNTVIVRCALRILQSLYSQSLL